MKLSVENGCYGYADELLLREVCLQCEAGEAVAVLGPNGAGKSTFLRCMLGFLPWRSGATLIDGNDIRKMKQKAFWKKVGYVPQRPEQGLALETEEMMLLGRIGGGYLFSQPKEEDRQAVTRWMDYLGIRHLKGKRCSRISGGELQLVMIGRALAKEPSLLVLDEPEAGLDFANRLRIMELIRELKTERGLQVVFNTHDPAQGFEAADSVLLLNGSGEGRFGPAGRMLQQEELEWAYDVGICVKRFSINEEMRIGVFPYRKEL